MQRIPEPLKILVEQIARLPGLGPKSAMRVAMTLLKWPEAETMRLVKTICGFLTNTLSKRYSIGVKIIESPARVAVSSEKLMDSVPSV